MQLMIRLHWINFLNFFLIFFFGQTHFYLILLTEQKAQGKQGEHEGWLAGCDEMRKKKNPVHISKGKGDFSEKLLPPAPV